MPEIPDCLQRRYKALDELIGELSAIPKHGSHHHECFGENHSHDPGIKLMCDFWNILKEDPNCNLSQAVKQRMGLGVHGSGSTFPQQKVACYVAGRNCGRCNDNNKKKKDTINKINDICSASQSSNRSETCPTSNSKDKPPEMLLTKALINLKEAASLDKKCTVRVTELMETQKELTTQIQNLEQREKEGVTLLKEADCMWSCMEEEYKKKIAESIDRQKELMKQLKEVEKSNNKWRKNKKELEDQIKSVNKCRLEINDKTLQKKNDIKVIEMEITDFTKRIANNNRLSTGSNQVLNNKKTLSDKKITSIAADITKLKSTLSEVQKQKKTKEEDGQTYVKHAREDLQKICKTRLQKKIENEDLLAEKEALLQEIDLLKQTCDQCKDKCQTKRNNIEEEIKKVDKEIVDYKYQCVQCHKCIDTTDVRKFCSDCPKCKEQRECITAGDHCDRDTTYDCICVGIKEKFLSNVFENMYTVMERQSKTKPGKALANSIVNCLKNSRNGKLNDETKKQVQEFVLNTVKKNLNLTIVGGAVKTRCEMDPDTYKQLMLCMKQVKAVQPPKEDKGTIAKKESCRRWGGPSECNCPGGAKYCACTAKAPPPPKDPTPCPPVLEKDEVPGTVVLCPHKESVGCGPDCAMHAVPSSPSTAVKASKPSDCATSACPFKKHMRAAQCVLGPESLNSLPKTYMSSTPFIPGTDEVNSRYDGASANSSTCRQDRTRPRDRLIEEVMGGYTEVTPSEKVRSMKVGEQHDQINLGKNTHHECKCNAFEDRISQINDCSSDTLILEGTDALIAMLRKRNMTHICKTIWNRSNASGAIKLVPKSGSVAFNRDGDARVHVFHPKLRLDKSKCPITLISPPTRCTSVDSKCYENTYDPLVAGKDFSQNCANSKKKVDGDIQGLLKDIMKSDKTEDNFGPDAKWMNVDSLIKLISSQSDVRKNKTSNVAYSEEKSPLVKKSAKTYNRNLQINKKPNKIQPKIAKIRNNNFSSYRAKSEKTLVKRC